LFSAPACHQPAAVPDIVKDASRRCAVAAEEAAIHVSPRAAAFWWQAGAEEQACFSRTKELGFHNGSG